MEVTSTEINPEWKIPFNDSGEKMRAYERVIAVVNPMVNSL